MSSDINAINANLVETDIKLFGNVATVTQVIELLAYIRNAIQSQNEMSIRVNINKNLRDPNFSFYVNDREILNRKAQPSIDID